MRWLRTFGEVVRSGLTIEEARLEPLLALRTAAGLALATGMVRALGPDAHVFGALAVVSAALSYTLIRTGYAYSQCFTAAYLVFLLGMGGQAWEQTVPERVVLTLLGGALAMLAYVVFPAWETPPAAGPACGLARRQRPLRGRSAPQLRRTDPGTSRRHAQDPAGGQGGTCRLAGGLRPGKAGTGPPQRSDIAGGAGGAQGTRPGGDAHGEPRPAGRQPFRPPEAERFAEALEADTARAAVDVREHRNPDWGRVEEALHAWEGAAGDRSPVLRREAELQKRALEDLAAAVSRTPLERDVGSAREEQRVRAAVAAEGDGSGTAHRGG